MTKYKNSQNEHSQRKTGDSEGSRSHHLSKKYNNHNDFDIIKKGNGSITPIVHRLIRINKMIHNINFMIDQTINDTNTTNKKTSSIEDILQDMEKKIYSITEYFQKKEKGTEFSSPRLLGLSSKDDQLLMNIMNLRESGNELKQKDDTISHNDRNNSYDRLWNDIFWNNDTKHGDRFSLKDNKFIDQYKENTERKLMNNNNSFPMMLPISFSEFMKHELAKRDLSSNLLDIISPNERTSDDCDQVEDVEIPHENINDANCDVLETEIKTLKDLIKLGQNDLSHLRLSFNFNKLKQIIPSLIKLDTMIGLCEIKQKVTEMLIYFLQDFETTNTNNLHTVLHGPPGTGKTEVGKILAEIYAGMGVIKHNKVVIARRTDLIGEYMGHSTFKTQKKIDEADGCVLFIDEAQSLGSLDKNKDSFAKECMDTLNINLTERKANFICIIAGYTDDLKKCFFDINPGLQSRFPFNYSVGQYTDENLADIFIKKINDIKWNYDVNKDFLINEIKKAQFKSFGRDIENLITKCKIAHSFRIFGKKPSERKKINRKDIINGLYRMKEDVIDESMKDLYKHMYI